MRQPLLEAVKSRVLLCDGAMGTQLQLAGLAFGACGELWNLEKPDRVAAIHRRYADAGSDMVLTNTFGGSRIALSRHGLAARTAELNEAAARLARGVMGDDRWVIGDIGPFGGLLEPLGEVAPEEAEESFLEQARGLLRGGVDALIVETQTALDEAACGVRACRRALAEAGVSLPVIVSFAFDRTPSGPPRTMMGVSPAEAVAAMAPMGVEVIASNCGRDLNIAGHLPIVEAFRAGMPGAVVMTQANAGSPRLEGGRVVYDETPARMAAGIPALVAAGARIVGGCCGTTPEHIALFRGELDRMAGS